MTNDYEHCIDLLAETASVEYLDRADLDHLCARQPDGLVRRLHIEGDDAPVGVPGSTMGEVWMSKRTTSVYLPRNPTLFALEFSVFNPFISFARGDLWHCKVRPRRLCQAKSKTAHTPT